MGASDKLTETSDSLVGLLGAQCTDLEQLLSLARDETTAAEDKQFTKIWDIVSERAMIGERLESYHRQIAELRGRLDQEGDGNGNTSFDITDRVTELANLIIVQDQSTRHLLNAARSEAADGVRGLDSGLSSTHAYMRSETKGLALSRDL